MSDLSDLIFIWSVIVFLWFSTQTVFIGVSSDDTGYYSSLVTVSAQNFITYGCFTIRHWVTVAFLTLLLCVLDVRYSLYARCMQPLLRIISHIFL